MTLRGLSWGWVQKRPLVPRCAPRVPCHFERAWGLGSLVVRTPSGWVEQVLRGEVSVDFVLTGHRIHSATLFGNRLHRQRPGLVTAAPRPPLTTTGSGLGLGTALCPQHASSATLSTCSEAATTLTASRELGRVGTGKEQGLCLADPRPLCRQLSGRAGPGPWRPADSRCAHVHVHGGDGRWARQESHPDNPSFAGCPWPQPWEFKAWRR